MMRLRELRKEKGMTQNELADKVGLSRSAIAMWEVGANEPDSGMLIQLSMLFGCSVDYLLGLSDARFGPEVQEIIDADDDMKDIPSNIHPLSGLHRQRVPMLGEVAAGQPIYAPEDAEMYVDSPVQCDAAITVRGDSMIPNYLDGDVVYIRCRPDVDDGQVAVVFMDDEAAIKHVYHEPNGLLLLSDNQDYAPIHATLEEYPNLRIFGVPVGFTRMYKDDPLRKIKKGFH